jgi:replicative DNA helicase
MPETDIHTNLISNRQKVNTANVGTGRLSHEEYEKIVREAMAYREQNLIIDRRSAIDSLTVKNQIIKYKRTKPLNFVVIDYLQRMKGDGISRAQQIESCITQLADMGRDENIIMIALSQLSGSAEHKSDSPIYSFFKESQAIVEACDVALVLFDENRGSEKSANGHEIKCTILQRDGISDYTVPLFAELQYSKFSDITKSQQDNLFTKENDVDDSWFNN